jgi:hypothetical protein
VAGHDELMRRRGELVARSRRLRMQWGEQAQALRTPFAVADQARAGAQWLLRNPQWPLGVLAVLLIVRPRRVFKLAGTVWWGWSAYRRVRRIFAPTRLR